MRMESNEEARRLARLTGTDYYVIMKGMDTKVVSSDRFIPPTKTQKNTSNTRQIIFVAFAKTEVGDK